MRILLAGLLSLSMASAPAVGAPPGWADTPPVGQAEGIFSYSFEKGDLHYEDLLTLSDGSKCLGKAMEWASQVLLFEADGTPRVFDVGEVEQFEFRRTERHQDRPPRPDLTVSYIERLPRDPSWHGRVISRDGLELLETDAGQVPWHPAAGTEVTFRVHVLNAGASASSEVRCRVLIDGAELQSATVPSLEAGREHVVEATWPWQDGRHVIRVELDPDGRAEEALRWNNTFEEPTDALAVAVVVASDRYEAFKKNANMVDSFCFEDWIQYHIRVLNALFAASIHPSTPQGILERVRCDRIVVVTDPTDPQQQSRWMAGLHAQGRADGPAEYAARWVFGPLSGNDVPVYDALRVDWPGLQGLALQLGLVDLTATDTTVQQCLVLDQYERYVQRRHLFPDRRTMMHTAGGFPFDERSAAFLNQTRGRPRGLRGDGLYQLPEEIIVEVRSNVGSGLADAQVDVFQLMSEGEHAGAIAGYSRADPLFSAMTDSDGRLTLLNRPVPSHQTPGGYELRPNPFGKIATDGSNGLLLLRLRLDGREEFHFLRLFDCNVAHLRGQTREYVHRLHTQFSAPGAPAPPAYAAVRMKDRTGEKPPMYVEWPMPPGMSAGSIKEFRIYRRTSFAGDGERPWRLVAVQGRPQGRWDFRHEGDYFVEFRGDGRYSLDTFYAVSVVDLQGRESSLSETGYLAYDQDCLKLAMDPEAAYITLSGDGPCQMIRWDGRSGMQPYGLRTRRFEEYSPSLAGLAVAADGRMIVADPVNHVLAFYDRGDLVELLPERKWWPGFPSDQPGEFYEPVDVAVDDGGSIYVADRANNRVQILDSRGRFKALVDEGFRFVAPHAVGYANGHLCVTDQSGTRCRVYTVGPPAGTFVLQLPLLAEADRALVGKSGKVYVSGRDQQAGAAGILVYKPEGDGAVFDQIAAEGAMGKFHRPRGLYLYRGGPAIWGYLVNQFPFDVRRAKIQ